MGLARFYVFIKPYVGLCVVSGLSLLVFTALGIPLPWFLKVIIDRGLENRGLLILLLLGIVLTYVLREIFFYISHYLFYYTGARTLYGVRIKLFKHLQSLSLRFYQEYRTGKLISNVLTDVAMLNGMISSVLVNMVIHLFSIICIMTALFLMSPAMTLICFFLIIFQIGNFTFFRIRIQRDANELREMMSEVSASLAETINGIKVVKSFGKERFENREFAGKLRPAFDVTMALNMKSAYSWIISESVNIMCVVVVLFIGSYLVSTGHMTVGGLVAYYTYFMMLTGPISALSGLSTAISDGMVSVERIGKLLDAVPEIKETSFPRDIKNPQGVLTFDEVGFAYEKSKVVLREFTLEIPKGKKVALVGPSGSGKSTIASLLMRFYDVTSGRILIDGIDIRDLSIDALRRTVGIVLQESFLFSGTVEENIRYGRETATHEEIVEACKMANAHDFIMELPHGYKARVGENGASLSGGQKQRIAIARAILKNPAVLILDEATSALDTISEVSVQEALDKLMENRTTVIIAHRLSTVRNSDIIVVLKDGRIAQKGSHSQLLLEGGIYRDLYALQLKDSKNASSSLFAVSDPEPKAEVH